MVRGLGADSNSLMCYSFRSPTALGFETPSMEQKDCEQSLTHDHVSISRAHVLLAWW